MFRKFYIFFILLILTNCTSPTALLGPVYTAVKTGNIYQTSLSYGSNRIMDEIKDKNKEKNKKQDLKKANTENFNLSPKSAETVILLAYVVDKIEISDVMEPEPLP